MIDQVEELRARFPGLAKRVDMGHPRACIKMFCLHCMGGIKKEVELCTCPKCPLYKLRFGRQVKKEAIPNTTEPQELNEKF